MTEHLTDEDRKELVGAHVDAINAHGGAHLIPVVERIVARHHAGALAAINALADQWNSTPDYRPSAYDQGRVDQRHDMTIQLYECLAPQATRVSDELVASVLAAHQSGIMGTCVNARGTECGWKAKKPADRHGNYADQQRKHAAAKVIEAIATGQAEATPCPA